MKRVGLLFLPALLSCSPGSPETQIKHAFETCVQALEAGDAAPVLKTLAPSFTGPEGMGPEEARLYLLGLLQRQRVGITVLSSQIRVAGPTARQDVELILTGRSGKQLLPEEHSRQGLSLRWEERDGHWKLAEISAVSR